MDLLISRDFCFFYFIDTLIDDIRLHILAAALLSQTTPPPPPPPPQQQHRGPSILSQATRALLVIRFQDTRSNQQVQCAIRENVSAAGKSTAPNAGLPLIAASSCQPAARTSSIAALLLSPSTSHPCSRDNHQHVPLHAAPAHNPLCHQVVALLAASLPPTPLNLPPSSRLKVPLHFLDFHATSMQKTVTFSSAATRSAASTQCGTAGGGPSRSFDRCL